MIRKKKRCPYQNLRCQVVDVCQDSLYVLELDSGSGNSSFLRPVKMRSLKTYLENSASEILLNDGSSG